MLMGMNTTNSAFYNWGYGVLKVKINVKTQIHERSNGRCSFNT